MPRFPDLPPAKRALSCGAEKVASEDRQSEDTEFQTVATSPVAVAYAVVDSQVGQKSRLDDAPSDDFPAAVLAVMALPRNDGSPRIVVESSKWFARFRDSGGFVVERSTGCKDRVAAESLLKKWERQTELEEQRRERALIVKTLVLTGLRSGELRSITIGQVHLDAPMPFIELAAKDEKNRDGSDVPLRADLADDLRAWLRLRQTPQTLRFDGGEALPPATKLFYVPTGLRRIFDRDLKAAGIPKKDDRDRTIDVHALRHTFGTMLSQNGVAPRTAQSAMRHSKIDLTMNCYTDPRLLDVAGALDQLPALSLESDSNPESDTAKATGTDGEKGKVQLAPMLATNSVPGGISRAKRVILGKMAGATIRQISQSETGQKHNEKGPLSTIDNGPCSRVSNRVRTGDLRNHNPAL